MNGLLRLYLAIRGSGWFVPSMVGGLPFPFMWQGWALFLGFLATVAVSAMLMPGELGWIARVALGFGYVGFGMLTYDGSGR